ncbi:MAG: DUF2188 domain-containing protein [Anaeroplasma sp.]
MATKPTQAAKKDTTAPIKKAPAVKSESKSQDKAIKPTQVKKVEAKDSSKPTKKEVKPRKEIIHSEIVTAVPQIKKPEKTVYHVSKRDNDGREWKVFIQGSSKVIKLFDTQAEALEYAKNLCKNKDDGSYVVLHRLDGKIRNY